MSQDDEGELVEAAKLSILRKIANAPENSVGYKGALELAMAYTVLDRAKLPGEVPNS